MNYQKIYDQLIDRAKTRKLEGYKERHHVIPRCIGGTNDSENLVDLTAREHFIAHKLLCEIYPNDDKIFFAYRMMAIMKQSNDNERLYHISSREFDRIRTESIKKIGNMNRGKKLSPKSKESIEKQLATRKLNGYTHSIETKQKISNSNKGRKLSDTHKQNISRMLTNNPKVTGRASTPEKEMLRRAKIKASWVARKGDKHD